MSLTVVARPRDYALDAAAGLIPGVSTENKHGSNRSIDVATVPEDVWSEGGVIVEPTAPRIHDFVSTSLNDAAAGTGLRTCRAFGLQTWDSAETSEVVEMNGLTDAPTANAYVIIHRIVALTWGALGVNVGAIRAVAQVDGTLTAVIQPGDNQTLMATYGLPSTRKAYVTSWWSSWARANAAVNSAELRLLANTTPDIDPNLGFRVQNPLDLFSSATTYVSHPFDPPLEVPGPAILKVQVATVSANGTNVNAGFDLYLRDNPP